MSLATTAAVVGIASGVSSIAGGMGGDSSGGGSSGGGSSGGGPMYTPTGLSGADTGWQSAFDKSSLFSTNAYQGGIPGYNKSYYAQQGINYDPYQQSANQAGQQYGQLANMAGQQMNQYGQQAQQAYGQQADMYGNANQVMNTAFDPQNALYARTQQLVQDQTRAGQAARGLGNSQAGAMEEAGAMSNFNIDWQNQQLARQTQGLQAGSQANLAGTQVGAYGNANLAGQLGAGEGQAGYTQQAGQVPISAQQYIAGQPAQMSSQYTSEMANLQALYNQNQNQATQYMGLGAASQNAANQQAYQQQQFNANQQQGGMTGVTSGLNQLSKSYNTPGSWLSNTFGGQGSQSNPYAAGSSGYNPYTSYADIPMQAGGGY